MSEKIYGIPVATPFNPKKVVPESVLYTPQALTEAQKAQARANIGVDGTTSGEPVAYLYNGLKLPALPQWDKAAYPHAVITTNSSSFFGDKATLYVFGSYTYTRTSDGEYAIYATDCRTCKCPMDAQLLNAVGDWSDFSAREGAYIDAHPGGYTKWVNFDLLGEDGGIFMAATAPVPVYPENGGSGSADAVLFTEQTLTPEQQAQARANIGAAAAQEPTAYLYNGVELPPLPDWDKTAYPYAIITEAYLDRGYVLWTCSEVIVAHENWMDTGNTMLRFNGTVTQYMSWKVEDTAGWKEHLSGTLTDENVSDGSLTNSPALWVSFDMRNQENAVYLAASEPVPVYPESGKEVDLSGYALKTELPTKVSQLENDKGYLTEHQSLDGYAKTSDIPTKPEDIGAQPKGNYLTEHQSLEGYAKAEDIPKNPSDIGAQPVGNYALKSEIPAVPVQSVNGKTGAVSLTAADVKARPDSWMPTASDVGALPSSTAIPTVPTKVSAFTNDAGYLTEHQDISGKLDASAESVKDALGYVPANVKDVFEFTSNPQFTNIFDTVGVEYGKILDIETGTVTDVSANLATTDFIQCKANDVFRVNEDFPIYNSGNPAFVMYDSNKAYIKGIKSNAAGEDGYYVKTLARDENGYITAFQVIRPSATGYIRICNNTTVIGKNPILTINEDIAYENGYGAKLNPRVRVDQSQIVNAPQKNCWSILPNERLNIAYSSIGRKPINTVEHFIDAATNFGYNVLKCDVRPTSDGELVCCHDAGFTFDGSGYITTYDSANQTAIHDVTAATVLGYSFRTGEHPCLVGDYLDVCRKYGKVAFVTIRNEYMDVVIPKLLDELKKHNMTYSTIINCMTYNSLVTWRTYDQSVMINYTLNAGVAIDQKEIDRAIGLGYCSLCGFGLNSSVLEPNHTCDFEYARANGIRLLQAIAYKEGSPEACYAMGYDGCQIAYAWNAVSAGGITEEEVDAKITAAIGNAIGGSY